MPSTVILDHHPSPVPGSPSDLPVRQDSTTSTITTHFPTKLLGKPDSPDHLKHSIHPLELGLEIEMDDEAAAQQDSSKSIPSSASDAQRPEALGADMADGVVSGAAGVITIVHANKAAKQAHELKETASAVNAFFKFIRGLFQLEKGSSSVASTGVQLAGQTCAKLAVASAVGTTFSFSFMGLHHAHKLKELHHMKKAYETASKKQPGYADFKNLKFEALKELSNTEVTDLDKSELEAIKKGPTSWFSKKIDQLLELLYGKEGKENFNEMRSLYLNISTKNPDDITAEELTKINELLDRKFEKKEEALAAFKEAFDDKCKEILSKRKEQRFKECFGKDVWDQIKKKDVNEADQVKIVQAAEKALHHNLIKSYAATILSFVAAALSFALEMTPIGATVEFAATILFTVGFLCIQLYEVFKSISDKKMPMKEKIILALQHLALGIGSLAAIILVKVGLTVAKPIVQLASIGIWIMAGLALFIHSKYEHTKEKASASQHSQSPPPSPISTVSSTQSVA